jgi:CTP-dependent riboflavin kinase
MGKYVVFKELKRKIKASDSSLYKAIRELEKERILSVATKRPMMVTLMEKHLLIVKDETLKY